MKKLTLHLGMHRCASTTMQNLLRANRQLLAERGIGVVLRADMEADNKLDMRAWHRRKALDMRARRAPQRLIAAVDAMPFDHVIISEESLLSTMPAVRQRSFYPFAEKFFASLQPLANHFDLRFRFVVRRQDRYIESVYAFRLARGLAEDFESFLASFPDGCFDWNWLTGALDKKELATNSRFAVMDHWQGSELNQRLAELVDIDPDGLVLNSRGNPSLPAERLPFLLALNRAGLMPDRQERKLKLLPAVADMKAPKTETLAAHFSAKDQDKFKQSYDPDACTGFSSESREAFLAAYEHANKLFLDHDTVYAAPGIWALNNEPH